MPRLRTAIPALLIGLSISSLFALERSAQRDFERVQAMYQNANLAEAKVEAELFLIKHPSNEHRSTVRFIRAETQFYYNNYQAAIDDYKLILRDEIDPVLRAESLLHMGICYYYLKTYHQAQESFQTLISEYDFESYKHQGALWMARIFAEGGQYLSAKRYYEIALPGIHNNSNVRLEMFSVLLNLREISTAIRMLDNLNPNDPGRAIFPYLEALLSFYLRVGFYDDFDGAQLEYRITPENSTNAIRLLNIRRWLLENNYDNAQIYLSALTESSDTATYYRALLLRGRGFTPEADYILADLVGSSDFDIAVMSYFERLKILFESDQQAALTQLQNFIETNPQSNLLGEAYFLAGSLSYQRNEHENALRYFSRSKNYDLTAFQKERTDAMTGECWLMLGMNNQAEENLNRYLNLYPKGLFRDRAWFNLGITSFQNRDYNQTKSRLNALKTRHPASKLIQDANFYLAESDFFLSNYTIAAQGYRTLLDLHPTDDALRLRLAQSLYFNQNFAQALSVVDSLVVENRDSALLRANIHFNRRQFSAALESYQRVYDLSQNSVQQTEALSYKALTLYQLGRFREASDLYLELSGTQANPDTYLFLAAKSAMQSGNTSQAMDLYDRFLTQFPDSAHLYNVLSDMATIDFNLSRYGSAYRTWASVLRRYKDKTGFTQQERQTLREVFSGIELCLSRVSGFDEAEDLITMIDLFSSDYIKFELQYILVKLYADRGMWEMLLNEAESIRATAGTDRKNEIELLMAESLIKLNQTDQADSLLAGIYTESQSIPALLKWAELEILGEDYQSALEKLRTAYAATREPDIWIRMLECSEYLEFQSYSEIWELGSEYAEANPWSLTSLMRYKLNSGDLPAARLAAINILDMNLSDYYYAQAYLVVAETDFRLDNFQDAIRSLVRIRELYPDFPDIIKAASFLQIKSLLQSGAISEAQQLYWESLNILDEDQILNINNKLESLR